MRWPCRHPLLPQGQFRASELNIHAQDWTLKARWFIWLGAALSGQSDNQRLEGACGQVVSRGKGLRFVSSQHLWDSKSISFLAAWAGKSLHRALTSCAAPSSSARNRCWVQKLGVGAEGVSHRVTFCPCGVVVWERCCAFQASFQASGPS